MFGETVGNPILDVMDIPTIASIAHDANIPLIVDSTFTTPYLIRPFELDADIVMHSATKFLSGHGIVIGSCSLMAGVLTGMPRVNFPN